MIDMTLIKPYENLRGASLRDANLRGASLFEAHLRGADLHGATLPYFQICPETGAFLAYKKLSNGVIAVLSIPEGAARTSSLVGRKCRAEYAVVVSLSTGSEARSMHDENFVYEVGAIVYPDSYDPDIRVECTNGIHFFITKVEAEAY